MAKVYGLTKIKQNLAMFSKRLEASSAKALVAGGLYLQAQSMRYVPVDEGNLRISAYTRKFGMGFQTIVYVGYTAKYAIFVHEIMTAAHGKAFNMKYAREIAQKRKAVPPRKVPYYRLRGEMQQAKFLEKPYKENRPELLAIIAGEAMIL